MHLQGTGMEVQTDNCGPARAPLTHCMLPTAQPSSWVQQQQQVQHASSRQAPRQTSMQSFMALHSSSRQPNLPAAASAAPPSFSAQQPAKAPHATGMLADDVDDCIDLTSQPEPHNHTNAPQAGHNRGAAQPCDYYQPAEVGTAAHSRAMQGTEKEALEDIIDDLPEDLLMECSTNLLNPGIRVHKYSFGFPLHAETCTSSSACWACHCFALCQYMYTQAHRSRSKRAQSQKCCGYECF